MHFDPSGFSGTSLFWQMLYTYWMNFTLSVKVLLGGYLIVVLYIMARGEKKAKFFFGISLLVLILVCLNPWMCRYLVDKWGFFARYFRFFWLIPVSLGYTYLGIQLYEKAGKKGRILLGVAVGVLFILASWQTVIMTGFGDLYTGAVPNTGMIPVSNIYKVEDDILEVSDIIEKDSGDPNTVKKTLYNHDVFIEMRTYDAAIIPFINFGNVSSDYNLEDAIANNDWFAIISTYFSGGTNGVTDSNLSSESLKTAMDNTDCEYVILPNDNPYIDIWNEAFTSLGVAGRYTVYKVK
ncbi:hypothetical protein SAMN02910369_02569 [Lachnospiraceae bacterium NE2001]|nr:hypothetical protein SAMN02910369_02569 [Lachnospiraceae bacterium NE2001]